MRFPALFLATAALLVACGDGSGRETSTVSVFAASSLAGVLEPVGSFVEAGRPVEVEFNFAGSSALREQILDGAAADVFISANETVMEDIIDAGLAEFPPGPIASNSLTIAVPVGNPGGISGLSDFADSSLTLGLCAPEVPCGALAVEVLANEGVDTSVDTLEPNVRALLSKVELGELDGALVYRTDVMASTEVEEVALQGDAGGKTTYFVAQLSPRSEARLLVGLLTSPIFQERFADAGYGAP
ncbi:MAG: molybdate ABC transporter substrate-binding protein [Acidimicrobiia bacterium]|nr:molybdate ABC transporter substrate-binding protein [Acidimicrobiia bacterium]